MSTLLDAAPRTAPNYAARVQRLFHDGGADYALTLGHPTALRFFTGGGEGVGVLKADSSIAILAAALQLESARRTGFPVVEYGHRHEEIGRASCRERV